MMNSKTNIKWKYGIKLKIIYQTLTRFTLVVVFKWVAPFLSYSFHCQHGHTIIKNIFYNLYFYLYMWKKKIYKKRENEEIKESVSNLSQNKSVSRYWLRDNLHIKTNGNNKNLLNFQWPRTENLISSGISTYMLHMILLLLDRAHAWPL